MWCSTYLVSGGSSANSWWKEHRERVQGRSWNKIRNEIRVKKKKCTRQESKVRGIAVKGEDLPEEGSRSCKKSVSKVVVLDSESLAEA